LVQPDDTSFEIRELGGEHGVQLLTLDGYTVLRDQDGWWVYAIPDGEGGVKPSGLVVGQSDPRDWDVPPGLAPPIQPRPEAIGSDFIPSAGTVDVIAIRVDFSDVTINTLIHDTAFFTSALGNVSSYFTENSYGALTVNFVLASTIYNLGTDGNVGCNTMAQYGTADTSATSGCPTTLIQDAVAVSNPTLNFANYDGVMVIHAGVGDESDGGGDGTAVWSVRRSFAAVSVDGTAINSGTVIPEFEQAPFGITGVTAHEFSHDLGLPDLYDIDGSGSGGASEGAGAWDIMAAGTWLNNGHNPAHMSAWCKIGLSWIAASDALLNLASASMPPVETTAAVLRFRNTVSDYFLVEFRSATARLEGTGVLSAAIYDKFIPGSGLLIWHINQSANGNRNPANLRVDLEEADGAQELELNTNSGEATDAWYSGNPSMPSGGFTASSSPASRARDGSESGLEIKSVGAAGANIGFDYQLAALIIGWIDGGMTFGSGVESYQQFRFFTPHGANRLGATSVQISGDGLSIYGNRGSPASPTAYVDKAETPATSTETLVLDSADSTPLPSNPGWWFVNFSAPGMESVTLHAELEVTTLHDGSERAGFGGVFNGWLPILRNETSLKASYDPWHRSTSSSYAGTYSLSAGDASILYPGRTESVLVSPIFNLSGTESPRFSFRTSYDFQYDDIGAALSLRLDGFWVEALDLGSGAGWKLVEPVNGYPVNTDTTGAGNTLDSTYSGLPGQKAFTMESGGWMRYDFDLSAYSGKNIALRFRFWSNPAGYGVPDQQTLYIDQISVNHRTVINEVLASEGTRSEFVEIHNPSSSAVDLDGWRIRDGDGGLNFAMPGALLPLQPGAYLWLQGGSGVDDYDSSDGTAKVHMGPTSALNPADDSVTLADERGGDVDFVRFGSAANDVATFAHWTGAAPATSGVDTSYGRNQNSLDTDDASDWESDGGIDASGATPGAKNLGAAIPELEIAAVAAVGVIALALISTRPRRRKGTL
jgi:immune inhibitor A